MIIYRALYRETVRIWLAIVIVLVAMFAFILFGHLLSRAARGEFPQVLVLGLLGLQLLRNLDILLPLALYFALLLALGRWYRDSEMAVLAACGIGLPQLLRPVLVLTGVCVALTAMLSLYLNPWAHQVSELLKYQGRQRSEVSLVVPGVFSESRETGRVLYAESVSEDGEMQNVFVTDPRPIGLGMIVARTGRPVAAPGGGDPFIALRDGAIYDGEPGHGDYRIAHFETLNLRVEPPRGLGEPPATAALSTMELWRSGDRFARADLHWRVARPLGMLILAAFALALAYTDPRRGRAGPLIAAILVYFIYTNLLGFALALLRNQRVPEALGLWWVHGVAAAVAAYLLWRRFQNRALLPQLRWRR
jgi:lipopolysaccharide export system permease protein